MEQNDSVLLLYERVAGFFVLFVNKVSKFFAVADISEETDICAKLAPKSFCYSESLSRISKKNGPCRVNVRTYRAQRVREHAKGSD